MESFTVKFLDPFAEKEKVTKHLTSNDVLEVFNKVEWLSLINSAYLVSTGNIKNSKHKEVLSDFWYFSVQKSKGKNKERSLIIIPNYAFEKEFTVNEIRFSLEFFRPKKVKNSKFKQLFGGSKEKWINYSTHSEVLTLNETERLINNFVNFNYFELESEIINTGPLMQLPFK